MRKCLILVTTVLLTASVLFVLIFGHIPLGEPNLRIEFYPLPPWQVTSGGTLEVSIGIANDGWLLAWARDVRATVFMPEGFTNSRTGTNECELNFFTLCGGDGLGNVLDITVPSNILPGNYNITIKVAGENVPEKIFTPDILVVSSKTLGLGG
jgi:hypothetical protein